MLLILQFGKQRFRVGVARHLQTRDSDDDLRNDRYATDRYPTER